MINRSDMVTVFVVRPDESGRSHEFLQLHRHPDDFMGNTWQIIRGGMNEGETAVQGALRELREEAGLVPKELYRLGTLESFYIPHEDTLWHAVAFVAIVGRDAKVTLNEEHDDFRWLARADVAELTMWASERALLDEIDHDILRDSLAKPHLRIL